MLNAAASSWPGVSAVDCTDWKLSTQRARVKASCDHINRRAPTMQGDFAALITIRRASSTVNTSTVACPHNSTWAHLLSRSLPEQHLSRVNQLLGKKVRPALVRVHALHQADIGRADFLIGRFCF